MAELLRKVGTPAPTIIGVDEISIRKGHTYRIVVSDLERKRPIWFGGKDRSTERMDAFHEWLGPTKNRKIKFAVMDMWKPFASSLKKEGHAPQAAILFDKFHVMRHLGGGIGQSQEVGIPQPSADGGSR
jgi:transposase